MSNWPASKARRVLAALERIGWRGKRQRGSHRLLTRPDWPDYDRKISDSLRCCVGLVVAWARNKSLYGNNPRH